MMPSCWREEVLEAMPLRKEISIPEIVDTLRPGLTAARRHELIGRTHEVLTSQIKWGTVRKTGTGSYNGWKVTTWMRM